MVSPRAIETRAIFQTIRNGLFFEPFVRQHKVIKVSKKMKVKQLIVAVALLAAPPVAFAQAQQYRTAPYRQLPQTPPSWSYDPYTSGLGPCPQKGPWDTQPCSQIMPPTYGQPSYWPR